MKISQISDIHGDLEKLVAYKNHITKSKPDVVVCTGDLIGPTLTPGEAQQMQYAHGWLRTKFQADVPLKVLLQYLEQEDGVPDGAKEAIKDYRDLELKSDKNAREQCDKILGIFSQFPQPLLTIPGNWDPKNQYFEWFEEFDIHKKTREIGGVEFTGYGGADVIPISLPPTRAVEYSEEELYNLFTQQIPEIAVTHVPPKGILDRTLEKKYQGSWAGLAYIRNPDESSDLYLCGHVHEVTEAKRPVGLRTLVVNPGNLGEYGDTPEKGRFAEIDYNGPAEPTRVRFYRINDNGEVSELNTARGVG